MTFDEFKRHCDRICQNIVGVCCDDLPDWDYYGAWEEGQDPHWVVCEMLAEQGYAV